MSRVDDWYGLAHGLIDVLYDTGFERLCATMLLDMMYDLYQKTEPAYSLALSWVREDTRDGLSLAIVCGVLSIRPERIKYLVNHMEPEPPHPHTIQSLNDDETNEADFWRRLFGAAPGQAPRYPGLK